MTTPVRVGETIEGSRTMRNRPYQVLRVLKLENLHPPCVSRLAGGERKGGSSSQEHHSWSAATTTQSAASSAGQ